MAFRDGEPALRGTPDALFRGVRRACAVIQDVGKDPVRHTVDWTGSLKPVAHYLEMPMAVAQRMSVEDYEQFVQSHPDGAWELHDGILVEKPRMGAEHGVIPALLGHLLLNQIDRAQYQVVVDLRVRRPQATVFLPDVMVVPAAMFDLFRGRPGTLAIFSDPLPLIVEVWSPSTGEYDVETKLPVYKQRGDLEIWRIHPYERTVTTWVRLDDRSYRESVCTSGAITLAAVPGVEIAVEDVFAF